MRHIWSLIAGVVIAPLAWFLIAFGQGAMGKGVSSNDFGDDFILGGLLIAGVGLILGLIASLRTSPVGALFAAVIFLGASMFALFAPLDALDFFGQEWKFGGYVVNPASPLNSATLAVVGGMLLMAIFSPARWRGKPTTAADESKEEWNPPAPAEPWEPPSTTASVTPATEAGTDKSS